MNTQDLVEELKSQLCQLIDQSNSKITHCLSQLNESEIWWRPQPELSSVGNLILHITGNLRQWSTSMINKVKDNRDRESEFSIEIELSKEQLLIHLENETSAAKESINRCAAGTFVERVVVQGFQVSVMEALVHTTSHFQGHTHQIIMLTRMQRKENYQFHWSPEVGRDSLPM